VSKIVYDALGRQSQMLNPAIQNTPLLQQAYTPDGLLASLTDANNHATSFAYDGFDRLATTTYPLGSTEVLTYDADSNVLTRKTRANQTIGFAYDTLNRLKTKTPPSPAAVVSYGYDLAGRLTSLSDTSAAITAAVPPSGPSVQYATNFGYDTLNRPTAVTWNLAPTAAASTAASVTFGHAYNKANQRSGQTATDNSWLNYPAATPSTVSYTANALNQYTAVGAVTPTYNGNGSLHLRWDLYTWIRRREPPDLGCWRRQHRELHLRRAGPPQDQDRQRRHDGVRHRRGQSRGAGIRRRQRRDPALVCLWARLQRRPEPDECRRSIAHGTSRE
jgi:YD repeat-containing protein